jgi:L-cystine transport system substrate-binding protein
MKNRLLYVGIILAMLVMLVSACSPAEAPAASEPEVEAPTTAPAVAEEEEMSSEEGGRVGDEAKTGELWENVEDLCNDTSNSAAIAGAKERGTLRSAHGLFPPFAFQDTDNDVLIGIDLDSVHDLADVMGVELETQIVDWGVLAAGLQSDRYDVVASGFFALPEREEVIDFSEPYQMSGQFFFALKDRDDLNTIEDLNKPEITFVYGTGSAQKTLAENFIPNATVIDAPFRGQFILYEFLKSGRADATATDSIYLPLIEKNFPDLKTVPLNAEPIEPFPIAIGIKQDDVGMKICVDAYVDWLKETNTFQERLAHWQAVSGSSGDLE